MGMNPEQAKALLAKSTVPQPYLERALSEVGVNALKSELLKHAAETKTLGPYYKAPVAQQAEQALYKGQVDGSSPSGCTFGSTDVQKLNKTERRFHEHLWARKPWSYLGVQSITLKIGDDCRYTPDFVTVAPTALVITAWEVKGFMRDDALVKLKVAARMYPWIWFKLVRWNKETKGWDIEDVKP